ncbi:MAG: hypothetical protein QXI33_00435 [Candidatus Pacearchaeota archaeon]
MRLIGFNFKKISIEKNKEPTNELNINTDIQIKDIQSRINDLFKDQDILNIDYELKIKYMPDFAELFFSGNIALLMEKSENDLFKKILKSWKEKKVEDELRIPLLNIIFNKCNLTAMELEETLNIPFHIPTPKFVDKPKIGKSKDSLN